MKRLDIQEGITTAPPCWRWYPPRAAELGPTGTPRGVLTSVLKSPRLTPATSTQRWFCRGYASGPAGREAEIATSEKRAQFPLPAPPSPEADTCPQANVSTREAYISNPTQHWVIHRCGVQLQSTGCEHAQFNPHKSDFWTSVTAAYPPLTPNPWQSSRSLSSQYPYQQMRAFINIHTRKAPSARLAGVEPGFPGPMLEPQLWVILPRHPTLRNAEIK